MNYLRIAAFFAVVFLASEAASAPNFVVIMTIRRQKAWPA